MQQPDMLPKVSPRPGSQLARIVLATFVLAFIITRVWVILIMSRRVPDFYVHAGKGHIHIHHLNFGIILLSIVGGYLLFGQPRGRWLTATAVLYGIGLAWTFDEFGMWLHLGGPYWQRVSFDAVVIVAALLGLIAAAPVASRFRPRDWVTAAVLGLASLMFAAVVIDSFYRIGYHFAPEFKKLEAEQPN